MFRRCPKSVTYSVLSAYRDGVNVPPLKEGPTLDEGREVLKAGEKIPYKAHMALNYDGMHPNPGEYL